jgi:hypothetical protein
MTKTALRWYEVGRGAATQIKITPEQLMYLEARGFLCHELLFLLGGHIEFVRTSWKQFVLKFLEHILPISPICRWYPPENSILEWIGYDSQSETKVYRLSPTEPPITVFFVEYKPEAPIGGVRVYSFFNVPQLIIDRFLRPPFEENNDTIWIEEKLRNGLVQKFTPIPMTQEARKRMEEIMRETRRGLWEEFIK